jgi:hypothetical protein
MKKKIKIILGYLIIFIFEILNKIFDFKFFHLYTERIGHLTTDFDSALFNVPKNTILLIGHGNVANKFIFKFLKKQKKIFFCTFFLRIISCIIAAKPNSNLILKHNQVSPDFSFHLKFKSKIKFPVYSNDKKNNILSKYDIKRDFVGLFSRNNLYFEKNKIYDPNFHDFRNFNFRDYSLTIEYLINKNNSIIKLGETFENENFDKFNKNIITSLDYSSNDEVDFFLHAHSRYNVFSQSGASGISEILRKKTVYINLIPFSWWKLSNLAPGSIIMPKKIFDLRKKKFLTFKEILFYEGEGISSIHTKVDPYKKNHLKYIDNSPQEILDAVIQMEEKIEGKNQEQRKKLNDIFWKSITNDNLDRIKYLKDDLNLTISTNFLRDNPNLL